jgi:hypothetical protein
VDDAGNIGPVKIFGTMVGSAGQGSGSILIADNGSIASVTITGALIGSAGVDSGSIQTSDVGNVGPVRIGTAMIGSAGASSGSIQAPRGAISSVTIGGPLIGSAGDLSGMIRATRDVGPVKLVGDGSSLLGGTGHQSGSIISTNGDLVSVSIGGSLVGGSGVTIDSGTLQAMKGTIRSVVINKDFVGGSTAVGEIGLRTGAILAQDIATVKIGGNATSGSNGGLLLINSGVIASGNSIKSVVIAGNAVGSATNRFSIQARGQLAPVGAVDLAIGSVSIGGVAQFVEILGGFAFDSAANPDAQIGTVRVGSDWIASNIATGVNRGDAFYGNLGDASFPLPEADTAIISRIGSIIIAGNVFGTPALGDTFGFVAESVGSVKINGSLVVLTPGPSTDILPVSVGASTGDVNVLEVI